MLPKSLLAFIALSQLTSIAIADDETCVRDTTPASYTCHAYCGTMINYARACAEDGASDTGPYDHDCLCAQDSDFQSLVASCLDCGWCLWDDYGKYLDAPLSECSLPSEPTGTACAPCPSTSSGAVSSSASASSSVALSTDVPSSVISSLLSSASASSSSASASSSSAAAESSSAAASSSSAAAESSSVAESSSAESSSAAASASDVAEPSSSVCVRDTSAASYQCHAYCGTMINYARACAEDGASDTEFSCFMS
ncbi:hypothetical protein B5S29_g5661 [[Candida] boidinii]|nr:hypothetical protein B5S29_g5661 [[Candida] boidinii]